MKVNNLTRLLSKRREKNIHRWHVGAWRFAGAYHDYWHPSRGVVVLWRSVKVRLQFTCDLHLHVVPGDRFVLNTQKAGSEVKGYDVVLLCTRIYIYVQTEGKAALWDTMTQWWERMSCAVYRAAALTCSIFPISSCNTTRQTAWLSSRIKGIKEEPYIHPFECQFFWMWNTVPVSLKLQ